MRHIGMIIACIGLLSTGCQQDLPGHIDAELIGKWKLIEVRLDPGNGSGSFHPVASDARIEFSADETFKANINLCSLTTEGSEDSQGTYSSIDKTIIPDDCHWNDLNLRIRYEFDANNELIISYPCIEPCQYKYEKQ